MQSLSSNTFKLGSQFNNSPTVQVSAESEIKVEKSIFANMYPVVSNLMRHANGHKKNSIATLAVISCQFILLGCWIVLDRRDIFMKNLLIGIFFLVGPMEDDNLKTILPIVTVVISFICYCIVVSLFIYYHIHKSSPLFLYNLTEIILHSFIYCLITPLGAQAGSLIYYYYNNMNQGYIVISIFDILMLIIGISIIYLDSHFYGCAADLPKSVKLNFDYNMNILIFFGMPIFGFCTYLGRYLKGSMEYLVAILFLIFCIFLVCRCVFLPFPSFNTNMFMLSVFTSGAITTAYSFYDVTRSGLFRLVLYLILMVLCIVIYIIIFKFYTKRLFKKPIPGTVKELFRFIHIAMFESENDISLNPYIEALADLVTEPQDRVRLARICSFFPDFHQQLLAQTTIVRETDNLSIGYKFLLFDLKRIIASRGAMAVCEELIDVKKQSHQLALAIRDTWTEIGNTTQNITFSIFDGLSQRIARCNQKWEELLFNYPQNATLADEYSKYFIECCSNYQKATEWMYRAIQLNEGKIFDFDPAFVHFLNLFPKYVHEVLHKQKLVSIDELDARQREKLLDSRISHAKIRLELSKNVLNVKPNWMDTLKVMVAVRLIISLGVFISLFFSIGTFEARVTNVGFIGNITGIGENVVLTLFPILAYGTELDGITDFEQREIMYDHDALTNNSPIDWSADKSITTAVTSNYGMVRLTNTVNEFLTNLEKSSVEEMVAEINDERINVSIYISENGKITEHFPGLANIRTSALLFYDGTRSVAANMTLSWRENITNILRANVNGNSIVSDVKPFLNSFLKFNERDANIRKRIYLVLLIIFICIGLFTTIVLIVLFMLAKRNILQILSTFKRFKKDAINEAIQPLLGQKKSGINTNVAPMTRQSRSSNRITYFLVIDSIISLLIPALLIILYYQFVTISSRMDKYTNGSEYMCLRQLYVIESIQNIFQYSQLKYTETRFPEISSINTLQKTLQSFDENLEKIKSCHQALSQISFVESNISSKINEIENKSPCGTINQTGIGHSYFGCLPLSTGVPWYIKKITELQTVIDDPGFLNTDDFHDALHMALSHLYPTMNKLPKYVKEIAAQQSASFDTSIIITACVGLFASIAIFVYNIYFWNQIYYVFSTVMILILRIHPKAVIENSQLISFLLNRKDSEATKLSISSRLVINSKYPIAILNRAFLVDAINQSFTIVLSYDLSHVAGQDLSTFITDVTFVKKINEQYGKILSQNVICKKETGAHISCNVTVIPIYDEHSNYILCHAVVIEDLSSIESMAMKAEELRRSNEEMINAMTHKITSIAVDGKIEQCAVLYINVFELGETKSTILNAKRRVAMFKRFNDILSRFQTVTRCQYFNNAYTVVSLPRKTSLEQERYSYVVDLVNCTLHIAELFERSQVLGEFSIGMVMGGPLYVKMTSGDIRRLIIIGQPMKEAEELSRRANRGEILITDEIYSIIAKRDLIFELKSDESECKPIYRMKRAENGDIDVFD